MPLNDMDELRAAKSSQNRLTDGSNPDIFVKIFQRTEKIYFLN